MMSNVIKMGIDAHERMTVDQAIESAKERQLQDVLILGYDGNGDLIVRSSYMTKAEANFLIDMGKNHVFTG